MNTQSSVESGTQGAPPGQSGDFKEWLKPVQDPELYMSLVELGLIYRAEMEDAAAGKAVVDMTLTSPGCPAGDQMVAEVKARMLERPDVKEVVVNIVWEPKWDPKTMASEECQEQLGIW